MKLKYFFAAALAIGMTTSCSDFLDQDNKSNVSASAFYNTQNGFESLTNSMYGSLRAIYKVSPLTLTAGTDLFGDGKSSGVTMNYYQHTATEGNVLTLYTNLFKSIQLANTVIAYGGTTEASSVRQQHIDEARFVRAWSYFMLAQHFGPVALVKESFDAPQMEFERTDLKTIYEFIISEFDDLAHNSTLKDNATDGRANKRAAKFFLAKAYLTRGWLNGKDYESQEDNIAQSSDFQNAAKYAEEAINGEIPSVSIEDAFDIKNENSSEFFWSIQFSSATLENPGSDGSYQQAQFGAYLGGSEMPYSKAIDGNESPFFRLMNMYSRYDGRLEQTFMLELYGTGTTAGGVRYYDYYTKKGDAPILAYYVPAWATDADIAAWKADDPKGIKKNTIITKTTEDNTGIGPSTQVNATWKERRSMDVGVPCIKKFDDYTDASIANRSTSCSTHDVVVSRLGEAYLIAAEAYLMVGNTQMAAEMINKLRQRPGTIKTGFEREMSVVAGDVNIDFILDERAREMAGEYVRWTDLKRTHKLVEYVTRYNEDGVTESQMKGADGKYKILRPIPQDALDKNQNKVEQNPGY